MWSWGLGHGIDIECVIEDNECLLETNKDSLRLIWITLVILYSLTAVAGTKYMRSSFYISKSIFHINL